jgi:sugar (pentulose or hexulose) kinase
MQHIAIFDVGKTNKKCLVFDEGYRLVFEKSETLPETNDEDGDPCEDLHLLTVWVRETLGQVLQLPDFQIDAVHFSAYGASFVYLDERGTPLTPLYNYLKPFPEELLERFHRTYGATEVLAKETASPALGSLNSGMQLYRLKHERPAVFRKIKWALHLPNYLSWLVSGQAFSEQTSLGCHTMLWDFTKNGYHDWVRAEGLTEKFPPLQPGDTAVPTLLGGRQRYVGVGLHDSSAALIPYLASFDELFVLLSTGTWNIALNPFNHNPLTPEELSQDCLCYLSFWGKPVKASRLFAGNELEQEARKILKKYNLRIEAIDPQPFWGNAQREILEFTQQIVDKQAIALKLVYPNAPSGKLCVDGGFSKNEHFLALLAKAFPQLEIYAAEVPQATALGAAMAIHDYWNPNPLPQYLISLKRCAAA